MAVISTPLMDEYDRKANKFIQHVSDLRALGAQVFVDLPTIVFCGNQSAGKSSLLEAIANVQLPRSSGTCTRCVMEIRLLKEPKGTNWSCKMSLRREYDEIEKKSVPIPFEVPFGKQFRTPDDVELMTRRAQKALLNPSHDVAEFVDYDFCGKSYEEDSSNNELKFTRNVVCIEIRGPDVTTLTLIDLPGIIRATEKEEDEEYIGIIKDLVRDYINKEMSLIIATISAADDIDNQEIVRLANKVDPNGVRTLGVITKPDRVETGDHSRWFDILHGRRYKLHHGYFVVKNPIPDQLGQLTFTAARKDEERFFHENEAWSQLNMRDRVGVVKLRAKLSKLLVESIKKNLPNIKKEINDQLHEVTSELQDVPRRATSEPEIEVVNLAKDCTKAIEEIASSSNNKIELWQCINQVFGRLRRCLNKTRPIFVIGKDGNGNDAKFDFVETEINRDKDREKYKSVPQTLLQSNSGINGDRYKSLLHDLLPNGDDQTGNEEEEAREEISEEEITEELENARGRMLPGFVPYDAIKKLLGRFQHKWHEPSEECIKSVYDILAFHVEHILTKKVSHYPNMYTFMRSATFDFLSDKYEDTRKQIQLLNDMENGTPLTLHSNWMIADKINYYVQFSEALKRENREPGETAEVVAAIMAYLQLTLKRYSDLVAMSTAHVLVDKFASGLDHFLMMRLLKKGPDEPNAERLMEEDPSIVERRQGLEKREKTLREIQRGLASFGI